MRFLLLSSISLLLWSCASPYRHLQNSTGTVDQLLQFKPAFSVVLYKAQINVTGNYLSGILLIKNMPDSSTRLVFSSEMGLKFFDFEFHPSGDFTVHYILKKMNRKAVIKTLRKDFELILMRGIESGEFVRMPGNSNIEYAFRREKGYNHYVLDSLGTTLIRMERKSGQGKPVVTAIAESYHENLPDSIGITHHNFDFSIGLKKMER